MNPACVKKFLGGRIARSAIPDPLLVMLLAQTIDVFLSVLGG
jgi:hypothetical protein